MTTAQAREQDRLLRIIATLERDLEHRAEMLSEVVDRCYALEQENARLKAPECHT